MPTVSVILPTYNRAKLLRRAIQSVLIQTYSDFEIIIIDDGSTDDTEKVVKSFNDNRIIFIKQIENKGGAATRNIGLRTAQGKYVAFLDDDDEFLPEKLEKQMKRFQEIDEKVGLVYCGSRRTDMKKKMPDTDLYPTEKGDVKKRLLCGPLVCGINSVLIKKECFKRVGYFDEAFKSCQDWDMWKRIADFYHFDFVNEILNRMYLHGVQISSNIDSVIQGRNLFLEKYNKEITADPQIHLLHVKMLGKLYCVKGEWSVAFKYFNQSIRLDLLQFLKIPLWLLFEFPKEKLYSKSRQRD